MKAGRVIRIRVAPRDCLSVLDAARHLQLPMEKLSFDNACRIVFSALLQGAREGGVLPNRSGFEYNEMMQKVITKNTGISHRHKLATTLVTDEAMVDGIRHLPSADELPLRRGRDQPVRTLAQVDPAFVRRKTRYEELDFKNKQDPTNFTNELQSNPTLLEEWTNLCLEFWTE